MRGKMSITANLISFYCNQCHFDININSDPDSEWPIDQTKSGIAAELEVISIRLEKMCALGLGELHLP